MFSRNERRTLRRISYSRVTLVALFLLVLLFARAAWGVFEKERETQTRKERLETELAELKERRSSLEEDLARLSSPRGVEAEIRKNFNVAKPGEEVVILVEPKESAAGAEERERRGLLERITSFFDWF